MNTKSKLINNLFTSILFYLVYTCFTLAQNFQDCEPSQCGNNIIAYPFYSSGSLHNSSCGHLGFEVTCNSKNQTLITISNDEYVIQDISYRDGSVRMINAAFINVTFECIPSYHNFTLDVKRFRFAENHGEVILLQDCNEQLRNSIESYKEVSCVATNGSRNFLAAMYAQQLNLTAIAGHCEKVVWVPYEGQNDTDIFGVLRLGFKLYWIAGKCNECLASGGRCGYDHIHSQMQCFCPHGSYSSACPRNKSGLKPGGMIVAIVPASLGALIFIALVILYAKTRHISDRTDMSKFPWNNATRRNQNVEAFLKNYGSLAPKRYTNAEIKKITNNFEEKLGEGGYGTVYKGRLPNHRCVAVKKLKKLKGDGDGDGDGDDFVNEVVSIGRTNHVNIVSLLGFCIEGNKRALVYEYLPNGSLERFMHSATSEQSLPLETLLNISLGIAKGLDYLHRGCNARILHFDIKPHNILLDEELSPKISDFGLARLCLTKDSLVSMSEARGTIGYIAPEVFCRNFGGVSHKSDVYSYGMMLLDFVCGRKNIVIGAQLSSEKYFPDWVYHQLEFGEEDEVKGINNDEQKALHRKMTLVGLWCIQSYPSNRPPMNKVIEMLEGPVDSLQVPPKPDLSSPPRSVFESSF